jgi:predicted DNA-binding transcriptional regulator AlpA
MRLLDRIGVLIIGAKEGYTPDRPSHLDEPQANHSVLTPVDVQAIVDALAAWLGQYLLAKREKLMSRADLASYIGCHERSISNFVQRGDLPPPIRLGGLVFWDIAAIKKHWANRANRKPRKGRGIRQATPQT